MWLIYCDRGRGIPHTSQSLSPALASRCMKSFITPYERIKLVRLARAQQSDGVTASTSLLETTMLPSWIR